MENKVALPIDLVNAILNFLGDQQYKQVYPLIAAIQKEASTQIAPPAAPEAPAE